MLISPAAFVHAKAHVDETAEIGARTKVWQFASVTRGTIIGEDCTVSPFALLDGPVIGDRTIISMYVAAGAGFRIGSDVFIGPSVVFCNDAWPSTGKDGFDYDGLVSGRIVCVRVEDGASIGAGAILLPGVTIGKGAMIAAGASVSRDVPANHLLTRDGALREIEPHWTRRRMRSASDRAPDGITKLALAL
jgi:UDP-2-acetamido-3-amino-2,3-dideoxy-glucuronate N-acetyltransferase